jgi:DMSO/TMAO reductase YedYZ molybdopterin-dependent catalytic subunit
MVEVIRSPDTLRENRVPPGQRARTNWPVLHYGSVPKIDTAKWRFRLFGAVDKPLELNYDQFLKLPRVQVFSDIHCVTTWSRLDNIWEGVSARSLRDLVRIDPSASYAIVHAEIDFTTNLTLDDFFQEDVLFAIKHDSEPISASHGGPVRLVVPRLYFWKSAKWATGVEFSRDDRPGFWESRGYHNHGDPWTEERFG